MNKAERLAFGESLMTHAMTFTAVSEKVSSPACHDRFISGQVGPHTPVDCPAEPQLLCLIPVELASK